MGGNIRGYEEQFMEHLAAGEFSVDDQGRVWKLVDLRHGRIIDPPRRAEKQSQPHYYLQVRFMHRGRRLAATAHRVVYRALKGPIPPGYEINHDNGLKDDNRPSNLIAELPSANQRHANRFGLVDQWGERNPARKLTNNEVGQIRLAYSRGGYTMEELGRRFGVRFQHISRLVRGLRRPKQGGPIATRDLRHNASPKDPITGRFLPKDRPEDLRVREMPA